MKPAAKPYAFLVVVLFGIYGCAKTPLASSGDDRPAREKLQKLESEHQSVVAARDQYRQKLVESEKQQLRLKEELETLRVNAAREASALAEQLQSRTAERDGIQVQYDGFRKTIKDLIGQAEAALPTPPAPSTTSLTSRPR